MTSVAIRAVQKVAVPEPHWTPEIVIAQLVRALATLAALPPGGYSLGIAQSHLETLPDAARRNTELFALRPPTPSARRITQMDETLRWLSMIPEARRALRKIVGLRAITHPASGRPMSWTRIGHEANCNPTAAKTWHAQGVGLIVSGLNRAGIPIPREPGQR